jgi:(1->4)-alpha-D-glucan 1-alpha-D-glucosylmutase
MPAFRIPASTYRIQFHAGFRFVDGRDLVPYLQDLGITDLYSSPRFQARRGSSHGYDIADPERINSELGTEQDFDELAEKLKTYGMGLLLDIVPNHMAASSENPWWLDVLENGPASPYASFFDIEWRPATSKAAFLQDNRVLLPTLGTLYGTALEEQQFTLKIDDGGIFARLYDTRLPLDPKTWLPLLEDARPQIEAEREALDEFDSLLEKVRALPDRNEADEARIRLRREQALAVKQTLWRLYHTHAGVKRRIDETLWAFNGVRGELRSFDRLDDLLSRQAYRVAFWKIGYEEINYRRFFDVNDLVGVRMEDPAAFEARHRQALKLLGDGKITGLRIDHIDGLNDPAEYLRRLHGGDAEAEAEVEQKTYIVAEKILGRGERLPDDWPICGTTGYDFLNVVNGLQLHAAGVRAIENTYAHFSSSRVSFSETCYARNKQVMYELFPGEVNSLGHHLGRLAAGDREARDVPLSELVQALVEMTACLPVYRTYIRGYEIARRDRRYIEETLALARSRTPKERIGQPAFDFLRRVLLLDPPYYLEDQKEQWLRFVMRWQQFSGPVMAKGLEDTASYTHNSLISMNEVGSDPVREEPPYDIRALHRFLKKRAEKWPYTLNATATHDTKRGEDVRARLNVLSEMAEVWEQKLYHWSALNERRKKLVEGQPVPLAGEESLIYQTLIGAWPLDAEEEAGFGDRLREFIIKAAREAKTFTSWIRVNQAHEDALLHFVGSVLETESNPFRAELVEFVEEIAPHGMMNSLAQTLLKIAAPGAPDFYQGTELWSLSLVDPDNRRPVDYKKRIGFLEYLKRREAEDRAGLLHELAAEWRNGGIKLYLTYKALDFRRDRRELFSKGSYLPVEVKGERSEHAVAFARRLEDQWAVCIVPRWPRLLGGDWRDTCLELPEDAPRTWSNVLTGEEVREFGVAELLRSFPVALLSAGGSG